MWSNLFSWDCKARFNATQPAAPFHRLRPPLITDGRIPTCSCLKQGPLWKCGRRETNGWMRRDLSVVFLLLLLLRLVVSLGCLCSHRFTSSSRLNEEGCFYTSHGCHIIFRGWFIAGEILQFLVEPRDGGVGTQKKYKLFLNRLFS